MIGELLWWGVEVSTSIFRSVEGTFRFSDRKETTWDLRSESAVAVNLELVRRSLRSSSACFRASSWWGVGGGGALQV